MAIRGRPGDEKEDWVSPIQSHRALRQQITGFHFEGFSQGQKTLSIYADKLRVEKAKIGVFRFGLSNQVKLENAHIKIYLDGLAGKGRPKETNTGENPVLGLDALLAKDSFSSTGVKRISSVVMSPVRVEVVKKDSVVTEISSGQATIRLRRKDLLFKGDVRVCSGDRLLEASRIIVDPKSMKMECDQGFILRDSHGVRRGRHMVTDIFLSQVSIPGASGGTTTNN